MRAHPCNFVDGELRVDRLHQHWYRGSERMSTCWRCGTRIDEHLNQTGRLKRTPPPRPAELLPVRLTRPCGNVRSIDSVEKEMIATAVSHYGNIGKAAAWLGLSRSAMYYKAEKYGINLMEELKGNK